MAVCAAEYMDSLASCLNRTPDVVSSSRESFATVAATDDKWWTEEGSRKLRTAIFDEFRKSVDAVEKDVEKLGDVSYRKRSY